VDEDNWLKLDNGSIAQEDMFVSLFHIGGQLMCPSPMLLPPMEKGTTGGPSQG
jgi:hypothetical protein